MMEWNELPLLKSSFFTNLNVQTLSHLVRSGVAWSETFMPVAIWDNTAIIATSSPNYQIPNLGIPIMIVRAEEYDLVKLYKELFSSSTFVTEAASTPSPITSQDVNHSAPSLDAIDMPNLDFSGLQIPSESSIETKEQAKMPEMPTLDFSSLGQIKPATHSVSVGSVTPPPPPPDEVEEVTKRFEAPSVNEVNNVVAFTPPSTVAVPSQEWNLQAFLKDYDRVMLLTWKGTYLEVSTWLGAWQINPSASKKIDVTSNSIFKIPLKSTFPYHGYVVGNAVNDSFFQNFNGGRMPEHITVFPVYENESFAGEIVCITSKVKGDKVRLEDYEIYLSKTAKVA